MLLYFLKLHMNFKPEILRNVHYEYTHWNEKKEIEIHEAIQSHCFCCQN